MIVESINNNLSEYLEYENFCYIYGNLQEYTVVDGGIKGGYLIRATKNVFGQQDVVNYNLSKILQNISLETMRLVKGETKKYSNEKYAMIIDINGHKYDSKSKESLILKKKLVIFLAQVKHLKKNTTYLRIVRVDWDVSYVRRGCSV